MSVIDLAEGDYVRCFWHANAPGVDFLGCLFRAAGEWRLAYRFRYHSGSTDPWDKSDVKNWYKAELGRDATDAQIEAAVGGGDIAFRVGMANFHRVDVRGGPREFLALMNDEGPSVSIRSVKT